MKLTNLTALNEARAAGKSVLLFSDVERGAETLTIDGEGSGDIEITTALKEAGEKAHNEDRGRLVEIDNKRIFIQVFNPARRIVIVGAVHIAQPLVPMARLAGYAVTIVDPRGAWATPERFPDIEIDRRWPDEALEALEPDSRTAIVTLTHDPKLDDPALTVALRSDAFYIGALGGKKTAGKRVARLTEAGFGPADFARIRGPVGLDIGAISPAEIAVSIVGQITETLHRPERAAA
ncbi:MAG: xanthine dehydrogenase [Alphaproteobacteria bacterium]|nr:xanthine dehydrogenase [Alphaproteobacteria bacterium]